MNFCKYHGAGNDFILIDNRASGISLSQQAVADLCHRRFGIGADGLMLLENTTGFDFRMVYYNSDGLESTMCGNGGRCITAFARHLGIITDKASFMAIDGPHKAYLNQNETISLEMKDVDSIQRRGEITILNTGSPHYISPVANVNDVDVYAEGRRIRNLAEFGEKGINVNFVQPEGTNQLYVRTYERGVEDETLSCGTGVTAAAIASTGMATGYFAVDIATPGGNLKVTFNKPTPSTAVGVVLTGPAVLVYSGSI